MSGLHHRHPGDGWVECGDHRHWGLYGAAGLFLVRRSATDLAIQQQDGRRAPASAVVLQHRAVWSHEGGTWGIPGGAIAPGETPAEAALREAGEEAGVAGAAVRVLGEHVLDHPTWSYTTVVAEVLPGNQVEPSATDAESIEVRWVPVGAITTLPLHPAFAAAVPSLLEISGA